MSDNETPWYYSDKVIPYDKGKLERYKEIYINRLRLTLDQIESLAQGQMYMGTAGMSGEYAVVIVRDDPHMDPVSADVSRSDPIKPITQEDVAMGRVTDITPPPNSTVHRPHTGPVSTTHRPISENDLENSDFTFGGPGTFTAFSPPTPPAKTLQQIINELKVRAYDLAQSDDPRAAYADADIDDILRGIIADLERLEDAE